MTVSHQLKLIRQVSGLTQEKLAHKLGVSFVTLNRWLNGKAHPRAKAQARVEELYRTYTGQKQIPVAILQAKRLVIAKQRQEHPHILKTILKRRDIYNQLLLSLTFNTNRIEGSTLTEPETAAILFDNVALPDKTLIEQMEAKNHQAALNYLFDYLVSPQKLNEALILRLHSMLLNGIQSDAGHYRRHPVRIVGSNVPTANYIKVPELMTRLSRHLASSKKNQLQHIAQVHSDFEKIHPFSDGNGRIGRLLIHAMLLRAEFPPALILARHKPFYIRYLNQAQQDGDISLLEDFLCDAVIAAFRLIESKA